MVYCGVLLGPDDALTVEDVVMAIGKGPWGGAVLMFGDINTNLAAPEGQERDEVIVAALVRENL